MQFGWNFRISLCVFILYTLFGKCESRADHGHFRNEFSEDADTKYWKETDVDGPDDSLDKTRLINDQDVPVLELGARPLGPPKSFIEIRYKRSLGDYSRDFPGLPPPGPRESFNYHTSHPRGETPGFPGLLSLAEMDRMCRVCRRKRKQRCIRRYCVTLT